MARTLVRILAVSGGLLAVVVMPSLPAGSSASRAGTPRVAIGPHQSFFGEVNGNHSGAEVYVVCPGPMWVGRTGPPTGGQPVGVLLVRPGQDRGYTGDGARAVAVGFLEDPSARIRLEQYGVTKDIPTTLSLPCEGTGTVRFQSVPKSAGSVPDDVSVTYVNIAA